MEVVSLLGPPACGPWVADKCPEPTKTFSISPTDYCATVGDAPCFNVTLPEYDAGKKHQTCTDPCGNQTTVPGTIKFTVGSLKWSTSLPATFTAAHIPTFTSTASVEVTSSDEALCHAPAKATATVTWTVNPMPVAIGAIHWLPIDTTPPNPWPSDKMGSTSLILLPESTVGCGAYANCGSDVWRFKVIKCEAQIRQAVRLCPGQISVDSALISGTSDCAVLRAMKESLKKIADFDWFCSGKYYSLAAVQAHEDIHKNDILKGCNDAFTIFKAKVEAITSYRGGCDPDAAASYLTNYKAEYSSALQELERATTKALFDSLAKDNVPGGQMSQAEHAVVDPLIEQINLRLQSLDCP